MRRNYWRLPTISELILAFDYESGEPKIDGFKPEEYWSSTAFKQGKSLAWGVSFSTGYPYSYDKCYSFLVRCAKETKRGELEWSEAPKNPMTWYEAQQYCERLSNEK